MLAKKKHVDGLQSGRQFVSRAPLKRRTHVVHYCKDFTPVIAITSEMQFLKVATCRDVVYTLLRVMAVQLRGMRAHITTLRWCQLHFGTQWPSKCSLARNSG
jgi:hypothetical protein